MSQLNYKHLRYFRAVANMGNLTRAAEELGVSQSALSVQIKELELSLGQPLFDRVAKRLLLTEAGKIALKYAETIFQAGDELFMLLNARAGRSKQILRIGAQSTLSRNFQAQFLKPLASRSDLDLVLRSGSEQELLEALEHLDLDIVLANIAPPRNRARPFIAHPIADQPISLIGPAEWKGQHRHLKDYLAHAPLIVPGPTSSIRSGLDTLLSRLQVSPNIVAEIDDMAMMRVLCREGLGLAIAPPIVLKDELAAGDLFEIETFEDLRETFYAILAQRDFPNPLVLELLPGKMTAIPAAP